MFVILFEVFRRKFSLEKKETLQLFGLLSCFSAQSVWNSCIWTLLFAILMGFWHLDDLWLVMRFVFIHVERSFGRQKWTCSWEITVWDVCWYSCTWATMGGDATSTCTSSRWSCNTDQESILCVCRIWHSWLCEYLIYLWVFCLYDIYLWH